MSQGQPRGQQQNRQGPPPQQQGNLPAARNQGGTSLMTASGRSFMPAPAEWAQIREMGAAAFKSGMLPNTIKNAEAAAIVALKAFELGIPLMEGYAHIHVINGKPTLSREMMQTLIEQNIRGAGIKYTELRDAKGGFIGWRCDGVRPGRDPLGVSFTMEDAKRAKLLNKPGPWQDYPDVMCMNRAATKLFRIYFPDALRGCSYTAEELEPVPASIETTGRRLPDDEATAAAAGPVNAEVAQPDPQQEPAAEAAPAEPAGENPAPEGQPESPPEQQPEEAPAQPTLKETRAAELATVVDKNRWPDGTVLNYAKATFGTGALESMNEIQWRALINVVRNSDAHTALGEFAAMGGTTRV